MKTTIFRLAGLALAWGLLFPGAAGWAQSTPKGSNDMSTVESATFGAGCFWCTEAFFERLDGVVSVTSGYEGGGMPRPTYKQVCSGDTGHAEVVEVRYDPTKVSYEKLLEVFWNSHDPTTMNRQGADVGTQYRSAIFYHSEDQRQAAEASKKAQDASGKYKNPIVTQVVSASEFYEAEGYHQDYFRNNPLAPYSQFIRRKMEKMDKGEQLH